MGNVIPQARLVLAFSLVLGWSAIQAETVGMPAPGEGTTAAFKSQKHLSPYAGRNFPTRVYWGDTHLRTGMSFDAGSFGARLLPRDAYRFASGEEVTSSTGLQVKLSKPLDFLVVADHSDNMGWFPTLFAGDPEMLANPQTKAWYDMINEGGQTAVDASDALSRLPADAGYGKGVPMGADLPPRSGDGPPAFLVAALKDPISGNLDRIQIVKGWLDDRGRRQEKVYDVAWSGEREPGPDGKLPPVGNTVDLATATWTNTIGAVELITVWEDPDFDPELPAVYYARVLEIPTPRWTAYEAVRFGVDFPDSVELTTQERAYTSPIWYTP